MRTYSDWAPTTHDTPGLGLEDRQDWLVAPCMVTRDSGILETSNWESMLEALSGLESDFEVHRFGHWGPGWFEIVLVRPGGDAQRMLERIESLLAEYPVLDDEDFSAREFAAAVDVWARMDTGERVAFLAQQKVSIFAARRDELPPDVDYYPLVRE